MSGSTWLSRSLARSAVRRATLLGDTRSAISSIVRARSARVRSISLTSSRGGSAGSSAPLGSMSVSAIGVTVLLRSASEGATPERDGVPLLAVTRGGCLERRGASARGAKRAGLGSARSRGAPFWWGIRWLRLVRYYEYFLVLQHRKYTKSEKFRSRGADRGPDTSNLTASHPADMAGSGLWGRHRPGVRGLCAVRGHGHGSAERPRHGQSSRDACFYRYL